ncbi:hypothetical protein BBO99_00005759 [Phytophthora kernoviae]|uniref:PABS domain-containing protein n=2 Tax=Phytophthora kernoviae TaxID=325452 RepID=A0A421GMN1_9STRA|nr:hypothetical protein G195_006347 [Phytophthora kernoviae 00238/432]KAG2524969.1 hypothetical protein JM18_005076 [Phytophthora kernoviae]KAG2525023.1 hypothetical protein JM16_004725 [Phytophthora kernoviae]RLN45540.1 hypothetical protein BBI17_005771 [Phytophthora kernoviae]RLN78738.1 hypothetical protein BBO99_00005759 [Phytophthora kernoviae]
MHFSKRIQVLRLPSKTNTVSDVPVIHRSGEDYTYDELKQMLHDLREVDPEFVEQYKAEFVANFSREIVFSDDKVTVLDSFIEGEEKATRSFMFNDRLHLTQSELGHLDAIEPSSEVINIARRFFGVDAALNLDTRFVLHEKMGEDFLSEQSENAAFDLLILDVEAGESHAGVRAPPLSMLESSFLLTAKHLLTASGILAINVITESEDALRNVETHLRQAFSHGLRLSLPSNTVYFLFNEKCVDAPLEVDEYIYQLKEINFQTQYARTTELLEKHRLTMWLPQFT